MWNWHESSHTHKHITKTRKVTIQLESNNESILSNVKHADKKMFHGQQFQRPQYIYIYRLKI